MSRRDRTRNTSTAANFYTALKVMSKTHFYGRAAPEAILAVDLTALLHAEAAQQLDRLFPNREAPAPEGVEEEPSSDVDDDYEEPPARRGAAAGNAYAQHERAEHTRAADLAVEAGVPARRPRREAAAATNRRMDELHARGELN